MFRWFRVAAARYRLRDHMYARLIHGGTPDCPCARCVTDRQTVVELTGEPWNDPDRARYYRELEPWVTDPQRTG